MLSPAQKAAAWVGFAALGCFVYGGQALSVVLDLRSKFGDDDRILIQTMHAVAGCGLGLVVAGWAVHLLRGGQRPSENLWRGRPTDWSSWMVAVGFAFVVALLLSFGYDGARYMADAYRAVEGRGVHGTLVIQDCNAQEYGYKCEGTFRAEDGSFEVEGVVAYPERRPEETLDGWVSGPRPLGMFDGTDSAWRDSLVPFSVLGSLCLALLGFLTLVVVRKARAVSAPGE